MSVSRFLRRAALATAMAGTTAVALSKAVQWGISVRFSRPSPHSGADDATRGHLGLVRAHPGLRDLNVALTSSSGDAFLLDATHALAASALRVPTITGGAIRFMVSDRIPKQLAAAESEGDVDAAVRYRLQLAVLHAREGRFDEALAAAVRLAGDSPGDPRPRLAAAALCCLHGRSGTALEWFKSVPESARFRTTSQFVTTIVFAMPGSSPQHVEEGVDGMVVDVAAAIAEDTLSLKLEEGEWSILEELEIAVLSRLLRRFVSKHFAAYPAFKSWTWIQPPPSPINASQSQLNKSLVQCSQAILAPMLGARPLCGERLREVRSVAEQALVDAEAEADAATAVDVNLLLAFLAIRDGHFSEAIQRYKAAVRKNPSDCRPYELAGMLCSIAGNDAARDAWLLSKERHGRATRAQAGLQALLDELVVAAALGHGNLTARDPHRGHVLLASWREVDAGLAAALRDRDLTLVERVQLRGLHGVLRAKMQPLLDTANRGPENSSQQSH